MNTEEKLASIQLLPKGAFVVTTKTGEEVSGKFSLEVIDNFCEAKKIENYLEAINKITIGMSIGDYADLLCQAVTSKKFDRKSMLEFIDDEFDGMSPDFIKLVVHACGRLGKIGKKSEDNQASEGVKKKENELLTDASSESSASQPG